MSLDSALLSAPYPDPTEFQAFEQNHRYLESIWADLVRDYAEEFVAAHDGRLVAHSPDLDAIEEELDRLGVSSMERALRFVRFNQCEDLL